MVSLPGGNPPVQSAKGEVFDLSGVGHRYAMAYPLLSPGGGGSQIKQRPAAVRRWRYDRPPEGDSGEQVQKVLIHLDSRTVAMEVGIR